MSKIGKIVGTAIVFFTKVLFGASTRHKNIEAASKQAIFYANHSSHLDTILLWSSFPSEIRSRVRPVAAKDYWDKNNLTRFFAFDVLNGIALDRKCKTGNPMSGIMTALDEGASIIIFPEGTRGTGDEIATFKPGLSLLRRKYPDLDFIPVYLDNLNKCLPKGKHIPIPLISTVVFGDPLEKAVGVETSEEFLDRARSKLQELKND